MLFGAGELDALSGGAGWVGAGLLGCVLAWLFFWHLPAKDRQIENLVTAKDRQIGELVALMVTRMTDKDAQIAALMVKYREALDVVVSHCKDDSTKLVTAFREELDRLLDNKAGPHRGK